MVQHLTNAVWLLTWAAVIATEGLVAASTIGATMQTDSLNRLLRDNLVIECQRTGIRASFRRPGLDEARIQSQRLSFNDFSCRASNNGTHYVLTTTFAECGGTVIKEQGRAYNRIQLADSDRGSAASAARRQGRSFMASPGEDEDDDESSGSGDMLPSRAPAARRPEAGAGHLWSLPFVCEYSNRTQLQVDTPASPPAWKLNMSITFFQSDAYVAPLRHYPLRVYTSDELYVQVSPEAGGDHSTLRAIISSCFLSSAASEGGSKRGILVDRGCAIDGTLLWHGENELASHRRFSFKATRPFPSFSFLHCTVDLCSLRPPTHNDATTAPGAAAGPKLCLTQAQYCSQQRSARQPTEAAHRSSELVRVHSGALVIQGQRSAPSDGSLHQSPASQDRQLGQQQLSASLSMSPSVELRATSSWAAAFPAVDDVRASTPLAAPAKRATDAAHLPIGSALDRLPAAPGGPPGVAGMPAPAGGLAVGMVIGIAVGAFVVGCFTVGALWIIHTCTDPRRRLLSVPTTEDSGSQTSRSPISV